MSNPSGPIVIYVYADGSATLFSRGHKLEQRDAWVMARDALVAEVSREDSATSAPKTRPTTGGPWARAELALHEVLWSARAVITRWDADDVDAGAMDRDVERLRRACDEFPAVPDDD